MAKDGILAELLFDRFCESGPPFGGSQTDYKLLFKGAFESLTMERTYNSITPRANAELFFELKKSEIVIQLFTSDILYTFQ